MNTYEPTGSGDPSGPATAPTQHADLTGDLRAAARSLHEQFDDQVGTAVVDVEVQRVADRFADARNRMYVPLFVRRFAGHELRGRSGAHRATPLAAAHD